MSTVQWLEDWYLEQCDGEWEHANGISIETIDNPGWSLKVELLGTSIASKETIYSEERSDDDWIFCWLEKNQYHSSGGPKNLLEMLSRFKEWIEAKKN